PAQRQRTRREFQEAAAAERHGDHQQARRRQERHYQAGDDPDGPRRAPAHQAHTRSRPTRRSKPTTRAAVNSSSTMAAAEARLQSSRSTTWVSITIASVITREPPSRAGVMKKPSPWTKTSRPAVATPGRLSGSVSE